MLKDGAVKSSGGDNQQRGKFIATVVETVGGPEVSVVRGLKDGPSKVSGDIDLLNII